MTRKTKTKIALLILLLISLMAIWGCSSPKETSKEITIVVNTSTPYWKSMIALWVICDQRGHIKQLTHYDIDNAKTGIIDNNTMSYSIYSLIRVNYYKCLRCGDEWYEKDTVESDTTFYWRKP